MMGGWVFLFCAYFVVPPAVSVLFLRAELAEVIHAYVLWFAVLVVLGLTMGKTSGEKFGWPLILGIFWTTFAVPVLILIQRLTGLHLPLFTL